MTLPVQSTSSIEKNFLMIKNALRTYITERRTNKNITYFEYDRRDFDIFICIFLIRGSDNLYRWHLTVICKSRKEVYPKVNIVFDFQNC